MLARLRISQWDLALIGDGSGSSWMHGCGWAGVLIDRFTKGRRLFYGGMNVGSINLAELMPYMHALSWYHENFGRDRLKRADHGVLHVHIITDSQVICQHGSKINAGQNPSSNRSAWACMAQFIKEGYILHYHHIPRCTVALNVVADKVAGVSRLTLQGIELQDKETREQLSIYDYNPL